MLINVFLFESFHSSLCLFSSLFLISLLPTLLLYHACGESSVEIKIILPESESAKAYFEVDEGATYSEDWLVSFDGSAIF